MSQSVHNTSWPDTKDEIPQYLRTYWTFRDDMAIISQVVMKGGAKLIPDVLQKQALKQPHINHMDIEKTVLLEHESVYWIGMNAGIEKHIKIVLHALIFSKLNQRKCYSP